MRPNAPTLALITSRNSSASVSASDALSVLRNPGRLLIFEFDSMLVVMMMSGIWGCHRAHLRPLLAECYDMAEGLTALGCHWGLRHVYREYNTVADKLASDCIQHPAAAGPSRFWSLQ